MFKGFFKTNNVMMFNYNSSRGFRGLISDGTLEILGESLVVLVVK